MTCSHGRVNPTLNTKLRLFADSGGYCGNPACLEPIFKDFDGEVIHIGEIAHIISAGNNGPRANTSLSEQDRSQYENLLLLCPTCHTCIDKAEDKFPEALIIKWKISHKEKLTMQFGYKVFSTRSDAKDAVHPYLLENKYIFDTYGPNTDERFNPESSMPPQWRRKIREIIIPNNRKILNIIAMNRKLLCENEYLVIEAFRQHVDDFEAKHLSDSEYNGEQFPMGVNTLFK
jgi:hypothetical protein